MIGGEIILRPWAFCNLSAVIARAGDTYESLQEKVELATLIGSVQSMATNFPGLRSIWKQNCEEERLLGVDITGQMDSPVVQQAEIKQQLREYAIEVNKVTAQKLGINQSASVTCVKPSGNTSQLVDCASGLHARWAKYYIRNVRVAAHSPIYKALRDEGVPMDPENGQSSEDANTWVIHFPVKAPEDAITRHGRTAIEQCEYWLNNKLNWTEHNPSCFTGDTRFITNEGLKRFDQFNDGSQVWVLNSQGEWTEATVRSYGQQEVWEVDVERCGIKHTIRTTSNHLWPVTYPARRFNGYKPHLIKTEQLPSIIGSSVWKLQTVNPIEKPMLDIDGVMHGIVFGDGTRKEAGEGRKSACQIYLCNDPKGADSRNLAYIFEEAGYKPVVREDHQQIRFYGLPEHWKSLPSVEASSEYLRGFIAGWFAADGYVDSRSGGNYIISTVNRKSLVWLQEVASKAGLAMSTHIQEHHNESTFGPVTWFNVSIVKETLNEDFFLLAEKRERFTTPKFAKHWKVVEVRNTGQIEPVFCVEEPNEHLFVLEGNILTHNCTITYKPDEILAMINWVWEHCNQIGGMAFLPSFDSHYAQLPYIEITKEEYEKLAASFPSVDFSKIYRYEERDLTTAAQELACTAGICEL